MSATTTQLHSSGGFCKLRYDTIPVKSASANVSFYTNNSKMPNFELWQSCRKWAQYIVWILSSFLFKLLFMLFRKIAKSDYWLRPVCPSVRPIRNVELGSHWTDFHEVCYFGSSQQSVEKIQISLKSDMNIGYCTWRPIYVFDHFFPNSS